MLLIAEQDSSWSMNEEVSKVWIHRAAVEAPHPKNAPLAHLEAGQYKNSLVSNGLRRTKAHPP